MQTYANKKHTHKYDVYKNDVKFKSKAEIDPERAIWDETTKDLFTTKDDIIKYRIEEARKEKFTFIDLSELNLKHLGFPYMKPILTRIQYLFVNGNNISGTFDFSHLDNLTVLDISHNNIDTIIPNKNLQELNCKSNNLSSLPAIESLQKMDCDFNKLTNITITPNLKFLLCSNNKLNCITGNNKIEKLICNDNPIKKITDIKNIKYIDMSNTEIDNIDTFVSCDRLQDLVMNNTKITNIPDIKTLRTIEMLNVNIVELPYYPLLHTVFCSLGKTKKVSKKYKENNKKLDYRIHNGTFLAITIT